MHKVVILGGGVGGMSAAHELVERGFEVEVHEYRSAAGGKARSIPVPGSGTDGRPDLPGEHGFRFFPSFYKHLPDTLKRIPYPGNANGVYDNLVQAPEYLLAERPDKNIQLVVRFPESIGEWRDALLGFFKATSVGIPDEELSFFVSRLMVVLTSCEERRLNEYEQIPWWDFVQAGNKSYNYQLYLATGLTRNLVAMRAEEGSTRTVGDILIQLLLGIYDPEVDFDRVLDGPTSEKWISPWLDYLRGRGVAYHTESRVVAIDCASGRIRSVTVESPDGTQRQVSGDYYVSALPVEALYSLVTEELSDADPTLEMLGNLQVAWMNGLQIFLKHDHPIVQGHANLIATPWAITSISQQQFWPRKLTDYGDGTVKGCVSVDISDWDSIGIVYGKAAKDLSEREDVAIEVLEQMRRALRPDLAEALAPSNVHSWFLDPSIVMPNPTGTTNLEPLLINTAGSWQYRPEAATRVENLFLASDFVRTYTDLATMESANEAARRAVNAILAVSGVSAEPCHVWPLREPAIFAPLREYDRLRYKLGKPHAWTTDTAPQPAAPPSSTIREELERRREMGLPPPRRPQVQQVRAMPQSPMSVRKGPKAP